MHLRAFLEDPPSTVGFSSVAATCEEQCENEMLVVSATRIQDGAHQCIDDLNPVAQVMARGRERMEALGGRAASKSVQEDS